MPKQTYDLASYQRQAERPHPDRFNYIERDNIILFNGRVSDVFIIWGGPVLITGMFMQITQTVTSSALNMSWHIDPEIGVLKLLGDSLDINAFVAGEWVWAELDGTALIAAQTTALPELVSDRGSAAGKGIICPPGGIDIKLSDSTLQAGKGHLYIEYRPLFKGAKIFKGIVKSTTTSSSSTSSTSSSTSSTASTASTTSTSSSTSSSTTSSSSTTTSA